MGIRSGFTVVLIALGIAGCSTASQSSTPRARSAPVWGTSESVPESRVNPIVGSRGMVVSADRDASEWGAEILRRGGNAVDAAVATAFALAVSRPYYASIGGGGFLIYCPPPSSQGPGGCQGLDYRERAPQAVKRDYYRRGGKLETERARVGAQAAGVPGVVAGLLEAHERWGTKAMPPRKLLDRPIEWARRGVSLTGYGEARARERWDELNSAARSILTCKKQICAPGTTIVQRDLAQVLEAVARQGKRGFYEGWVAQKLVADLRKNGGAMTLEDLKAYAPRARPPVRVPFGPWQIYSMAPPSSGGTLLAQLLGYWKLTREGYREPLAWGSAEALHAEAFAMTLAFADRSKFFGDPDFVRVPVGQLISADYLRDRWRMFSPSKLHSVPEPGRVGPEDSSDEPSHTTHFSVVDSAGAMVAVTTTINDDYGSGFVPEGTGIFMNNEMDDFSLEPGVPNLYGLVGAKANAIEPGKRPLSSMTPTVVQDAQGENRIALGAAGGPRIITSVYQVLLNRLEFGFSLPDAVALPRIHTQWRPSKVSYEDPGFAPSVLAELRGLGYTLEPTSTVGNIHALERFGSGDTQRVWGAADPRDEGAAVAE